MRASMRSTAGRVFDKVRQLRRSEKAQGLVEYALIIALVSIGAILSMTFLRKEIRSKFFAAGTAIQQEAGFPLGGIGGDPPPNGTPIDMGPGGPLTNPVFNDGTGVTPVGSPGGPGVYVTVPPTGVHTNTPCTFKEGDYTFNGHWVEGLWFTNPLRSPLRVLVSRRPHRRRRTSSPARLTRQSTRRPPGPTTTSGTGSRSSATSTDRDTRPAEAQDPAHRPSRSQHRRLRSSTRSACGPSTAQTPTRS